MRAFVYRIFVKEDDTIYRDILIQEDKTLEDFHHAILDAYDLPEGEMASFYTSTENWEKGLEITLLDMGTMEHESVNILMQEFTIGQSVEQDVKYYIYEYDFLFPKTFHIERIGENTKIKEDVPVLLALEGEYNPDLNEDDMVNLDFGYEDLEDFDQPKSKKQKRDIFDDFDEFNQFDDDDDDITFENIDDLDL